MVTSFAATRNLPMLIATCMSISFTKNDLRLWAARVNSTSRAFQPVVRSSVLRGEILALLAKIFASDASTAFPTFYQHLALLQLGVILH